MSRYYYCAPIETFLRQSRDEVLGAIARESHYDITDLQRNAWIAQIDILQAILAPGKQGKILFEYSIPRMGRRIDTVLLMDGIVYVLEFKVNAAEFLKIDVEQVWDYALDLKNFHEASHDLTIAPILIATDAPMIAQADMQPTRDSDHVLKPLLTNREGLGPIMKMVAQQYGDAITAEDWEHSRYMPTPTIIQAASSLYLHHSVEDIVKYEASGKSLQATSQFIIDVIEHSRLNGEKSICFVTGVPGAGKTLVGLNVAVQQFEQEHLAVYLSGNQPLVDVLTEALARDKKKQEEQKNPGVRYTLKEARRNVKSFIQNVHHYRNSTLSKIKTGAASGELEIDPQKAKRYSGDGYSEVEHVAIFDEAQRAWTKQHLANWLKRKKVLEDFPMSEPEFLIWSLNLREDWAVIVCLVGGGQEINTGEAGIAEWLRAINSRFPDWNVFISDKLTGKEYSEEETNELISQNKKTRFTSDLHLAVNMRSFRAEHLSHFVQALLNMEKEKARDLFAKVQQKYPIVLTRSLDTAKAWLRKKKRGSERYGMLVSSRAQRLRPLAIDVRCKPDTVHWFLDDSSDVRSSLFLEDAASEFDVQGLELDWTCVVWDADLREEHGRWGNYSFGSNKWRNIRAAEAKAFQINAYRVLLTRARQGMVICIPEGNHDDHTRPPHIYDGTYQYIKSLGVPVI